MSYSWPNFAIYLTVVALLVLPNLRRRNFALGCLLPAVFFPIVIPAYLGYAACMHYFLEEYLFRRQMAKCNRLLPKSHLPESGTILIDEAGGWDHIRQRIWWTPDDLPSLYPFSPVDRQPQTDTTTALAWPRFEKWLWEQYVNPDDGRAKLIRGGLRSITDDYAERTFPNCIIVRSNSGGRWMDKSEQHEATPKNI